MGNGASSLSLLGILVDIGFVLGEQTQYFLVLCLLVEGGVLLVVGEGHARRVDELSLGLEVFGEGVKVHATNNYRAGERALKAISFTDKIKVKRQINRLR